MGRNTDSPSADEERDGEGPISREEVEARNTERSLTIICVEEPKGDVILETDGGIDVQEHNEGDGLNQVLNNHAEELSNLVTKLILLSALLLLSAIVWRVGTVMKVLGL